MLQVLIHPRHFLTVSVTPHIFYMFQALFDLWHFLTVLVTPHIFYMFQVKVDTSTVEVMDDLEPLTDVGPGYLCWEG